MAEIKACGPERALRCHRASGDQALTCSQNAGSRQRERRGRGASAGQVDARAHRGRGGSPCRPHPPQCRRCSSNPCPTPARRPPRRHRRAHCGAGRTSAAHAADDRAALARSISNASTQEIMSGGLFLLSPRPTLYPLGPDREHRTIVRRAASDGRPEQTVV
jgi:hypothetical protein